MCGIVGVLSNRPVVRQRLTDALEAMQLRGPDGVGQWWSEDGCVGLGHRRLAINDEPGGAQPMVSPKGPVAVVNGEFYGLSPSFHGKSDSLALLDSYSRYPIEVAINKLRGEFAFLLFDPKENRLMAARDRFGVKPLFWAKLGKEIWFASKPMALWESGLPAGWCEANFMHAASTQYPPSRATVFQEILSLPPGHFATVDEAGMKVNRYWSLPSGFAGEFTVSDFKAVLKDSVTERVRKDGRTAVLLSGGVDSASVLSLAAQTGEELVAYTMDFPESRGSLYSEKDLASKQATFSGVQHRVLSLKTNEILSGLRDAVRATQGFCVNGHSVAKVALAQAISDDGIKVVLTGEGADELLFGYRHFEGYFPDQESGDQMDPAGTGILVPEWTRGRSENGLPSFFHTKYELGRKITSFLRFESKGWSAFRSVFPTSLQRNHDTPLEHARLAWLDTALKSYILETLGDGAEMAHSVEGRPPFLDHLLWLDFSYHPNGKKTLLRDAMKGLVTDDILRKPKHPFMAPPLGDGLIALLREQFGDVEHPFVERKAALKQLAKVAQLEGLERLRWEPAMVWLLSSFYLQELWA